MSDSSLAARAAAVRGKTRADFRASLPRVDIQASGAVVATTWKDSDLLREGTWGLPELSDDNLLTMAKELLHGMYTDGPFHAGAHLVFHALLMQVRDVMDTNVKLWDPFPAAGGATVVGVTNLKVRESGGPMPDSIAGLGPGVVPQVAYICLQVSRMVMKSGRATGVVWERLPQLWASFYGTEWMLNRPSYAPSQAFVAHLKVKIPNGKPQARTVFGPVLGYIEGHSAGKGDYVIDSESGPMLTQAIGLQLQWLGMAPMKLSIRAAEALGVSLAELLSQLHVAWYKTTVSRLVILWEDMATEGAKLLPYSRVISATAYSFLSVKDNTGYCRLMAALIEPTMRGGPWDVVGMAISDPNESVTVGVRATLLKEHLNKVDPHEVEGTAFERSQEREAAARLGLAGQTGGMQEVNLGPGVQPWRPL